MAPCAGWRVHAARPEQAPRTVRAGCCCHCRARLEPGHAGKSTSGGPCGSSGVGSELAERLTAMTSDEWQAHMTREAARAIGTWLEGRGRLHQPIASLTLADLEAMAANAISRFVVLGMERSRTKADNAEALTRFLLA